MYLCGKKNYDRVDTYPLTDGVMKANLSYAVLPTFLFAYFLLFTLTTNVAHAQATMGLQMRPAVIEEKVEPGEVRSFTIQVTNVADEEKTLYLSSQDIVNIDSGGVPIFAAENETTPYELSSWVVLPTSIIVLRGGETRDVTFTVRVPKDATPGSHFGGIFFEAKPQQGQETGAAVGARVGTVMNLLTAGDITEDVIVREFSTEKFIYDSPPILFGMNIENRGNVLARPHGAIEIVDMFGKKVGTVEVNATGAAVFPQGTRQYSEEWDTEGLVFGRYSATLNIVYGEEERRTVIRSTSFWVLPLKPTLIVLGSILAGILLVYMLVRSYIRRKLKEMGVQNTTMYPHKYKNGVSKLAFVAAGIALVGIVLLILIFALFA